MIRENIICPKCMKKIKIKICENISNLSFEDVVLLDFLKCTCNKCGEKVTLSYPFIYENDKFVITHNLEVNKNKLTRITRTINDFKEKFLILSDDLNDIIIELLKDYIKEQTSINGEIRYEGKTEDSLLFFLFETKQDVKIKLSFYEDLLNSAHFIKKEIREVDSNNYLNFVRLK